MDTVVTGTTEQAMEKDQFLEDFSKVKDNRSSQMNLLTEDHWKDVVVSETQKIRNHTHQVSGGVARGNGWNCNRLEGASKCYSGLTGFY